MTTDSLAERIRLLEEANKKQEEINGYHDHELGRLEAARKVENVIDKYEFYCEAGRWEDAVALFAQKQPDVRAEIFNWGVYEGIKGIRNLYLGVHRQDTYGPNGSSMIPGLFMVHTMTTPVIEVARDGKTAKMLFISPGVETGSADMYGERKAKFEAYWIWSKVGIDFIKEDGEWKIWHYHVYGLFETSYYQDPTEPGRHPTCEAAPLERTKYGIPSLPEELKPNRPTTHPVWWYSPKVATDPVPAPPEPYETFDQRTAY